MTKFERKVKEKKAERELIQKVIQNHWIKAYKLNNVCSPKCTKIRTYTKLTRILDIAYVL